MANKQVTVQAIMTVPRYENTWCRTQIEAALRELRIPINIGLGVFYGQNMQRMMEEALEKKIDYIVTIDFDTLFTAWQLHRLISLSAQEDFDALCGIQCRRGKPQTLGYKTGANQVEWDGYPINIESGHFGLTVIRTEKLAKVEKPWFFCKPDENGEWSDNRIDSDVWFWQQWKNAGLKLWMDPGVRLGHMEEMCIIHDEQMQPHHVYPLEWEEAMRKQKDTGDDQVDKTMEAVPAGSGAE